jgi:AraC family transcriptional regulator
MSNRTVEMPALHLVGLADRFTRDTISRIPALWEKFIPRLKEIKHRKGWITYGACIGTPDKELEYTAAVEVDEPGPVPEGMVALTLGAGAYALFTHEGHIRDIGKTWDAITHQWMKEEGYIHRDKAHDFERYDERWNPQTGEGPVDIYLPIERARR